MKLLLRLSLTILSLLLILTACYFILPSLLASYARNQLTQRGYTDIEIEIGNVGLQSSTVDLLQMYNDDFAIKLQGLQANYQLLGLLSGTADSLQIDQITLSIISADISFPNPLLLSEFLYSPWPEKMPARLLVIKNLDLYDDERSMLLSAFGELQKQGQVISGEINLVNSRNINYLMSLEMSPDTGVDLQLSTSEDNRENPLSVKLGAAKEGKGLAGKIKLDLSQIAEMIGTSEKFSGLLQAKVSYFTEPAVSKNSFTVSAVGKDFGLAGWQVKGMTANLKGNIDEQGDGLRLEFSDSSQLKMQFLTQGDSKVEKLEFQLPRSLEVVKGGLNLSNEQGASIFLNNIKLEKFSVPEARLNNIAFTSFPKNKEMEFCMFKMQLTTPYIEKKDVRIELTPIQMKGVCPEPDGMKWWIHASTYKIAYEDKSYQLPLHRCEFKVGNSENGKLLDENPFELGGSFLCRSSRLSGEVLSRFRFNPITVAGHASYSVNDIKPDNDNPLISSLLKGWKEPFDIISGTLSVEGVYRWWKTRKGFDRKKLIMDLYVRDAGGYYQGIFFSGLNYQDYLELLPTLKSSGFSELSVSHVDIGFPVTSASAKIRISESSEGKLPFLKINDLILSLFDGKVKGNDIDVDMNADEQNLVLLVDGLDLAQIVDLQDLDGLSVTGRLDGSIPVTISANGIKITKGRIVAQEQGGRIQFKPEGGSAEIEKSALGSELVLRILEDLNYDSLIIDVDYDEDGEMQMKLELKGMNPKVDARRPVHLNLSLQQNLLTLLRGLRFAEGISNDIDRNVQKYFRKEKVQ